jgi:ATP-binding cassette subfamily B (MDR/TAP) protein 1
VALVGESGCGKSTVIALLERFYDPDAGRILVDGIDIKDLQLKWLRQQIGLVGQEPILFNSTIRENILYGSTSTIAAITESSQEEQMIAAAQAANAHKFIAELPEGYDTSVGPRGIQLSGGQKQRVAIARAIIRNPRILLLDEATSALDAESEHVVQEALERVMLERSVIVVAHRLSTVKNAGLIAVLKRGVVVEQGRHEELLQANDGEYAALVKLHAGTASSTS